LVEIKEQMAEKLSKNDFWMVVIENMIQENIEYQTLKSNFNTSKNTRDLQMALNLKWLSNNKFPKEKIIVWAHNGHVAKYADSTPNSSQGKMIAMGSFFTQDSLLNKQSYIIGFTSFEGTAGRLGYKTYSIRQPKPYGFENWINKTLNYAFVDFKGYHQQFSDKSPKFYLKCLGHNSFFKYDWTQVFDGIFYIKEMYPCKKDSTRF
jgi:erythromycin esterase-like protein